MLYLVVCWSIVHHNITYSCWQMSFIKYFFISNKTYCRSDHSDYWRTRLEQKIVDIQCRDGTVLFWAQDRRKDVLEKTFHACHKSCMLVPDQVPKPSASKTKYKIGYQKKYLFGYINLVPNLNKLYHFDKWTFTRKLQPALDNKIGT